MRKVFLHGELGDSLGKEWDLEIDSVQEIFCAHARERSCACVHTGGRFCAAHRRSLVGMRPGDLSCACIQELSCVHAHKRNLGRMRTKGLVCVCDTIQSIQ